MRRQVLGRQVVRVKLWSSDGRVLYSDEPRLIGRVFALDSEERALLHSGQAFAHVSNLSDPENVFEAHFSKLFEVYLGIRTVSGTPVLFEAYLPYTTVDAQARRGWLALMPVVLGALAVLFLVQIPLAWSLARRLRESQEHHESLLLAVVDSSERERRLIAADLHDGVVQGLAGASYSLSAMAERAAANGSPEVAQQASAIAARVREWIRELRSLVVSIAPPKLHDEGLGPALSDLAASARSRGINVSLELPDDIEVSPSVEALLYRVAQEAMRNAVAHSEANYVVIRIAFDAQHCLHLEVSDDGIGMAAYRTSADNGNHLGLRLLVELVDGAGGGLDVRSQGGRGTTIHVQVPVP